MKATIFLGTYASYSSDGFELYAESFVFTDEARAKAWYKNSIVDDIRENAYDGQGITENGDMEFDGINKAQYNATINDDDFLLTMERKEVEL